MTGMIYCIGNRQQGICKIGFTADSTPDKRLKALQTGNPFPLAVLGIVSDGEMYEEAETHNLFIAHRMMGEWFKIAPEIAEHFAFPMEPIDAYWVVHLTYIRKDQWESIYTNGMMGIFAPSAQEAIGEAKLHSTAKGTCVRAMAYQCPISHLQKAIALSTKHNSELPDSDFDSPSARL